MTPVDMMSMTPILFFLGNCSFQIKGMGMMRVMMSVMRLIAAGKRVSPSRRMHLITLMPSCV